MQSASTGADEANMTTPVSSAQKAITACRLSTFERAMVVGRAAVCEDKSGILESCGRLNSGSVPGNVILTG
jgi:hypothetical protein